MAEFLKTIKSIVSDPAKPAGNSPPDFSQHMEMQLSLVNTVWLWGTQIDKDTDPTQWQKLCSLIKALSSSSLVDPLLLKTALEFTTLADVGMLNGIDPVAYNKKLLIKTNTRLVYKQDKYNLLREETEGYSKLMVILGRLPISAVFPKIKLGGDANQEQLSDQDNHLGSYVKQINSLIGEFLEV